MYYPDTNATVKLTGSPSFQPNNLSSSKVDSLSYVRMDEVYVSQISGESIKVPTSKSKIYQTTFMDLQGKCVLAILSNLGIQIWSMYGDSMIFYFPLNSLLGFESEEEKFCRGVTSLRDSFCVGCSTGNILVFSSKDAGSFPLLHNLESEKCPISAMASSGTTTVAANDRGKLFGYSASDAFELSFTFPGDNQIPCTALCMKGDNIVVAGYASGHIRGFRSDIQEMVFEIAAHTRAVTGMTINQAAGGDGKGNELASVSPDQYLHVWALPDFRSQSSSRVSVLFSGHLENKMCTGVAFLANSDRICVAAYDEEEMAVFRRMK